MAIEPSEYPVRGNTSINVYHDRAGSQVTVDLEIFDISGRKLAMRSVSESASSGMTVVPCVSYGSGSVQNTGIYLYKVKLTTADGIPWQCYVVGFFGGEGLGVFCRDADVVCARVKPRACVYDNL